MSRSKPNINNTSPCKHYFGWSGSEGKLSFWDKNKGERGENVYFSKLSFVVLEDDLFTIGGYSEAHKSGIRGTEVRDIDTPITMYLGKNKHSTATYKELKSSTVGLKYAKPLYVAIIRDDKPMEIAKLTLIGSSFSAWINFTKGVEDYEGNDSVTPTGPLVGINIVGKSKVKKKGSNKYYEPKFETFTLTQEQDDEAIELDKVLQSYFEARSLSTSNDVNNDSTKKQTTASNVTDDDDDVTEEEEHEDAEDVDDLPF